MSILQIILRKNHIQNRPIRIADVRTLFLPPVMGEYHIQSTISCLNVMKARHMYL
jgi:hypothetical protein